MPAVPASTKISLEQKVTARAKERWPQLAGVNVRHRARFAYLDAVLPDGTITPPMPAALRRLRKPVGLRDLPRPRHA